MAATTTRSLGNHIQLAVSTVNSSELTAAANTETLALFTLPANATVLNCEVDVVTLFADAGSISAVTVQVGSAGDPNALFAALGCFTGDTVGRLSSAGVGAVGDGLAVKALFTATGANFGDGADPDLDAGQLRVRVLYMVTPD
jgi:hypothetical protein